MTILLKTSAGTVPLPGFNHRATWTTGIKSDDQSGNTSSTAESYRGFKAVLITVTLQVRETDAEAFKQLSSIFYAVKDGSPVVYNIIHPELNAFGVDQVTFIDDIRLAAEERQKVYSVTLTLKQKSSAPEIIEARTVKSTATAKQPAGTNTVSLEEDQTAAASTEGFAKIVEKVLEKGNEVAKDLLFS